MLVYFNRILLTLLILAKLSRDILCDPFGHTEKEKFLANKLRRALGDGSPYQHQFHDYMKQDEFLIKFIRDRNGNLQNAREKIIKMLKWRKDKRIDGIENEGMGAMGKHFKYYVDGVDREGNPLLCVPFGSWDLRKFILKGTGREKLGRYSAQLLERCSINVRNLKRPYGVVIIDLNGYNARQHGCLACIPFYTDLLTSYESNYPNYVKNFIFIHTPKIFEAVTKVLLPIISPYTKGIIRIFGYDKGEWQKEMLKDIAPDQLTPQFGGSKKVQPKTVTF